MARANSPAPPELRDATWLREAYLDEGLTGAEIAKLLGLKDASQVYRYLDRHGIERRPTNFRRGFATSVVGGIELTMEADDRYQRRTSPSLFAARLKAVISARAERDAIALRGALIELCAFCQAWAESIPFSPTLKPKGA